MTAKSDGRIKIPAALFDDHPGKVIPTVSDTIMLDMQAGLAVLRTETMRLCHFGCVPFATFRNGDPMCSKCAAFYDALCVAEGKINQRRQEDDD